MKKVWIWSIDADERTQESGVTRTKKAAKLIAVDRLNALLAFMESDDRTKVSDFEPDNEGFGVFLGEPFCARIRQVPFHDI